jgi:PIN domain nuclease of toxin-antitoxin system
MKYLLDTHTIIWIFNGDYQLSQAAQKIIGDKENDLFASIASLWEIAIKNSLNKLKLEVPLKTFIEQIRSNDIGILPIDDEAILTLSQLPFHHKDPFDRLIIAQAISNGFSIISKDKNFGNYPINLIW